MRTIFAAGVWTLLILSAPWCFGQPVAEPDLIIAAEGPGFALTEVRSAHLDRDDRLFVTQPLDGIVRVFNRDGQFVEEIGRPGEGPGEFRYPDQIGSDADRIWVTDLMQRRLHLFDKDGAYLESAAAAQIPPIEGADGLLVMPLGMAHDGALIVEANVLDRATIDSEFDSATIFRQEEDDLRKLVSFSVRFRAWRFDLPGGQEFVGPNPVSLHTLHALRPDGSAIILLERSNGERPRVRIVDTQTGSASTLLLRYDPIDASSALRRQVIDATVDMFMQFGIPGLSEAQLRERVRNGLDFPNHLAPVTAIVVSTDNTMWIRQFEPPEAATTRWSAYAPDGTYRSTLSLPSAARMIAANSEVVWTVEESDGFPILVRYRH